MRKIVTRALALCALTLAPVAVLAAPYSVTFNDTTDNDEIANVISGSGASVTLVLDNGNASAAGQTWAAATLQCVIFRFNGGGAYVAINSPAAALDDTSGSFVTDPSGVLRRLAF